VTSGTITPAVIVQVEDAQGFVVANSSAPISMSISTNPGHGALNGTTTVNAASGVATFSNLSINRPGFGYILTANSSGLSPAVSAAFNVTNFNGSGSGAATATTDTFTVTVNDPAAKNNVVVVGVTNQSATTVSSITWNGTNLTLIPNCRATGSFIANTHMEIWSLANASISATNNVVVTFGSSQTIYAGAAVFSDSASVGTCQTSTTGGASVSKTLAVNPNGGAAFDTASSQAIGGQTIAPGGSQVSVFDFASGNAAGEGSYALATTNSITMTANFSNGTNILAYGAVPINPVNPRHGEVIIGRVVPTEPPAQPAPPAVVADATKANNPAFASSTTLASEERVYVSNAAIVRKRED